MNDSSHPERRLSEKAKRRDRKRNIKMAVSGSHVKKIQRIIEKKAKRRIR